MHLDRNSVKTEIPLLDRQHEKYFQAVEHLSALCAEETTQASDIRSVLDDILDYAVDNFDTEELLMEVESYPLVEQHRGKHNVFKDRLDSYYSELTDDVDLGKFMARVQRLLVEWFASQIQDDDMQLAAFLQERRNK